MSHVLVSRIALVATTWVPIAASADPAVTGTHAYRAEPTDYVIESITGVKQYEQFGNAASTAGDIDGDGFSDLIVGAYGYGNGNATGRVFVHYGAPAGIFYQTPDVIYGPRLVSAFGYSVSAGDANGDGYSDVLVGAPWEAGSTVSSAHLFLGGPAGLDTTAVWNVDAEGPDDDFGFDVAFAGDVDGDGFDDILIGAPGVDGLGGAEGRVYLYRGTSSGAETSPAWMISGSGAGGRLGHAVASAGDLNGDGYDDVAVSAPYVDVDSTPSAGSVYVFHGSHTGLPSSPNVTLEGESNLEWLGFSVATGGDLNADGYADLLVGRIRIADPNGGHGGVAIYAGSSSGISTVPSLEIQANAGDEGYGYAVAGVGDVNGDGYADIAFADKYAGTANQGAIEIWTGKPDPVFVQKTVSIDGDQEDLLLEMVAPAGDVNGDGYSDVVYGSGVYDTTVENVGAVWVLHGQPLPVAARWQWSVEGVGTNSHRGWDVALGDWNSDGYADAAIGESGPYPTNLQVFNGGPGGLSITPDRSITIAVDEGQFARAVDDAGDVNGDGYADLVYGGRGYSGGLGRAYISYGSTVGPSGVTLIGQGTSRYYGDTLAGAGDVNGDGFADVIIGAWDAGVGGEVHVFHGSASGLSATPDWTVSGAESGDAFGYSLDTAGDWNGDGYADVIIGAPQVDFPFEPNAGRADIYLGGPSGLASTPAWTQRGREEDGQLGNAVAEGGDWTGAGTATVLVSQRGTISGVNLHVFDASGVLVTRTMNGSITSATLANAGDLDADGYADTIVGDRSIDSNKGRFMIIRGGPFLVNEPPIEVTRFALEAQFGHAVAGGGDVHGDGFPDFLVGAPYEGGADDTGRAFQYSGQPIGVAQPSLQFHAGGAPLALGGKAADNRVSVRVDPQFSMGSGTFRVEVEVKPQDTPFDGAGTVLSESYGPLPSGPVDVFYGGLEPEALHRWRWRVVSDHPVSPRSRWLSMSGNGVNEADVRTGPAAVSVSDPVSLIAGVRVGAPIPNPFRAGTRVPFSIDEPGAVRVSIFDARGRLVIVPIRGRLGAGDHEMAWDGLDGRQRTVAPGVYYYRIEHGGRSATGRFVRLD